jgi:hypothetical protein
MRTVLEGYACAQTVPENTQAMDNVMATDPGDLNMGMLSD